jgi:hypothetical protein
MIDILLSSFSKKQKSIFKLLKFWKIFVPLLLSLVFCFLYVGLQHIWWIILGIISIITFFVIIYIEEKKQYNDIEIIFQNYNQKLDELKETLENYKYGENNECNWYSEDKIIYLIECLENSLEKDFQPNLYISMAKSTSIPIISFIAGIIAEKWEMEKAIAIALFILLLVISMIGMAAFGNFICDIVVKSQSKEQKKLLLLQLKDLLQRDF